MSTTDPLGITQFLPPSAVDPATRVRSIAERAGVPLDVADDYLSLTGGAESGNRQHNEAGGVLRGPATKQTGAKAFGFGQVMADSPGGHVRTVGGRQYDLRDQDQNIEAGLRYFHEGGPDPVSRRLYYFGGPRARDHYTKTGQIPEGGDGYTTFKDYVRKSGGFAKAESEDPFGIGEFTQGNATVGQPTTTPGRRAPAPTPEVSPDVAELAAVVAPGRGPKPLTEPEAIKTPEEPMIDPAVLELAQAAVPKVKGVKPVTLATSKVAAVTDKYMRMASTGRPAAQTEDPLAGVKLTSRDAAWHFAMTPEQAAKMTRKQYRVLAQAVLDDQKKREAGQEILPPPLEYQNEMRKRAGLKPLDFNQGARKLKFGNIELTVPVSEKGVSPYYQSTNPDFNKTFEAPPMENRGGFLFPQRSAAQRIAESSRELPSSGVGFGDVHASEAADAEYSRKLEASVRQQVLQERHVASTQGVIDPQRPDDYFRQSGIERDVAERMAEAREQERLRPRAEDEIKSRDYANKNQYVRILDQLANKGLSELAKVGSNAPNLIPAMAAFKHFGPASFRNALDGAQNYLRDYSKVQAMAAQYEPPNVSGLQKGTKVIADMGFDIVKVTAAVAITKLPLSSVLVGESIVLNADKPIDEQLTHAALAYTTGKALEHLPEFAQNSLGRLPGRIGKAVVAHPEAAARTIGGVGFGTLSGAETALAGGSKEQVLGSIIGGGGTGALLAGGGPGRIIRRGSDTIIASEGAPEWIREVAGRVSSKRPVIFQSEGRDGEPRFASVYADPKNPRDFIAREVSIDEASGLLQRGRPAKIVPDVQFDNVFGARDGQAAPAVARKQIDDGSQPARPPTATSPRIPETPETVDAQIKALGKGNRKVVVIPPGQDLPSGVPNRLNVTKEFVDGVGTIIYDPANITQQQIRESISSGRLNELLGHVNAETPDATRVVVARDGQTGGELMSSYVEPGNEAAAAAEMQRQFAGREPTIEQGGRETELSVAEQRQREANIEAQKAGYKSKLRTEAPSDDKPEEILTAAIRQPDGKILTGKNHPRILLSQGLKVPKDRSGEEYGFVTTTGRFVSRAEAAQIAGVPNTIAPGQLYTEDLTAVRKQAEAGQGFLGRNLKRQKALNLAKREGARVIPDGNNRWAVMKAGTVDDTAHHAATSPENELPEPSLAQRDAGNYQMGHTKLAGMDLSIEIPEGGERKGVDKSGRAWSQKLLSHYGYIKRTEGSDGEHVDVFVKPGTPQDYGGPVFIVNQANGEGGFDEHKVMMGFADSKAARAGYLENYQAGWDRIQSIARYKDPAEFQRWLEKGDKSKPARTGLGSEDLETAKAGDVLDDGSVVQGRHLTYEAANELARKTNGGVKRDNQRGKGDGLDASTWAVVTRPEHLPRPDKPPTRKQKRLGVVEPAAEVDARTPKAKPLTKKQKREQQAAADATHPNVIESRLIAADMGYQTAEHTLERGHFPNGKVLTAATRAQVEKERDDHLSFLTEHGRKPGWFGEAARANDKPAVNAAAEPEPFDQDAREMLDSLIKTNEEDLHAILANWDDAKLVDGEIQRHIGREGWNQGEDDSNVVDTIEPKEFINWLVSPEALELSTDADWQEMIERVRDELPRRVGPDQPSPVENPEMRKPADQVFPAPKAMVRAADAVTETLDIDTAKARVQEWKDFAARVGKEEDHSGEVVLSLFDRTGVWSKPWRDAGYTVIQYDISKGDDDNLLEHFSIGDIDDIHKGGGKVVGVLAAPPCTSYSVSGAHSWAKQHDLPDEAMVEKKYGWWAPIHFDTPLEYANALVHATQFVVELANPTNFHALENPLGRIARVTGLPSPTLYLQPHHYGDPYTKKTYLWGDFNPELPQANVEPTEGSKIAKLRGDVPEQKTARSETPEGFAYAFFMANHTSKLEGGTHARTREIQRERGPADRGDQGISDVAGTVGDGSGAPGIRPRSEPSQDEKTAAPAPAAVEKADATSEGDLRVRGQGAPVGALTENVKRWATRLRAISEARDVEGLQILVEDMIDYRDKSGTKDARFLREIQTLSKELEKLGRKPGITMAKEVTVTSKGEPDTIVELEEPAKPELPPHMQELMKKAKAYDDAKAGATITDVTPAGYGPTEPAATPAPPAKPTRKQTRQMRSPSGEKLNRAGFTPAQAEYIAKETEAYAREQYVKTYEGAVEKPDRVRELAAERLAEGEFPVNTMQLPGEPKTIQVPDDGQFTITSALQAAKLHQRATGEAIPGFEKAKGAKVLTGTPTGARSYEYKTPALDDLLEAFGNDEERVMRVLKKTLELAEEHTPDAPGRSDQQGMIDQLQMRIDNRRDIHEVKRPFANQVNALISAQPGYEKLRADVIKHRAGEGYDEKSRKQKKEEAENFTPEEVLTYDLTSAKGVVADRIAKAQRDIWNNTEIPRDYRRDKGVDWFRIEAEAKEGIGNFKAEERPAGEVVSVDAFGEQFYLQLGNEGGLNNNGKLGGHREYFDTEEEAAAFAAAHGYRVVRESDIHREVADKIKAAPSFAALRKAVMAHKKSIYGHMDKSDESRMAQMDREPWDYLTAHGGVMNAKSSRAKTLERLANEVFEQTGLPRKPMGKFRGDNGLDFQPLRQAQAREALKQKLEQPAAAPALAVEPDASGPIAALITLDRGVTTVERPLGEIVDVIDQLVARGRSINERLDYIQPEHGTENEWAQLSKELDSINSQLHLLTPKTIYLDETADTGQQIADYIKDVGKFDPRSRMTLRGQLTTKLAKEPSEAPPELQVITDVESGGEINYKVIIPKEMMSGRPRVGQFDIATTPKTENGDFIFASGYSKSPEKALEKLLYKLSAEQGAISAGGADEFKASFARHEAAAQPIRDLITARFKAVSRGILQTAIESRKKPAIWIDNQLITPDGKYEFDAIGRRTKVQDLSQGGFDRNLEQMRGDGEGKWWGANDAAKARLAEIDATRTAKSEADQAAAEAEAQTLEELAQRQREYSARVDAYKLPPGKRQTLPISVKEGYDPTTVEAVVYGHWAIYKSDRGRYTITHVPSGMAAGDLEVASEAKRLVKGFLESGMDVSDKKPPEPVIAQLGKIHRFITMGAGEPPPPFTDGAHIIAKPPTRKQARNMAGEAKTPRPAKAKVAAPDFSSLHPQAREKFETAWNTRSAEMMAELLDPSNKGLRAEFEKRADIKLPATISGTRAQLDEWATLQPAAKAEPARLEDVGEKIGGARKDRWKERGLMLADLEGMTGGEESKYVTKQNIWKPDYAAMIEGGATPEGAAGVKVIYDNLAAKPKKDTPEERRRYLKMIGMVKDVLAQVKTVDDAKNVSTNIFQALKWNEGGNKDPETRAMAFSVYKGRHEPFRIGWEHRDRIAKMVREGFPNIEPWQRRFEIRGNGRDFAVTKRGKYSPIDDQRFETKELAGEHAKGLYEVEKTKSAEGEVPSRPYLDTITREGKDIRAGRDVSGDDFLKDFGFRGIEFGNWAASDERQRLVNHAYEALHDLAGILDVPPAALSLNGQLGLAFGARGGGWASAHYEPTKLVINLTKLRGAGALAHEWGHGVDHYLGELERANAYQGAGKYASGGHGAPPRPGSLSNLRPEVATAFEGVMQALFKRNRTQAEAVRDQELMVEKSVAYIAKYKQMLADAKANEEQLFRGRDRLKLIKEMEEWVPKHEASLLRQQERLAELRGEPKPEGGYGNVETSYHKEATALSGKSTEGYWTRPTEMFARAFESYVFDRMKAASEKSDYLVHAVEGDRYTKEKGYKGNPYPAGEERDAINAAMDKLVKALETKETEKGVALFSLDPGAEPLAGLDAQPEPPSYSIESNRVALNNKTALRMFNEAQRAIGHEGPDIAGAFELSPVSLAKEIRAMTVEGASEFADAIMRAAKTGDGKVVFFSTRRPGTRVHELFHETSFSSNTYLDDRHAHMTRLTTGINWTVMSTQLKRMGYPDDNSTLVEEAAAWIAEGKYEALGLDRDEAIEWMDHWFTSFAAKNGVVTLRQFRELADEAEQARRQTYQRHAASQITESPTDVQRVETRRQKRLREELTSHAGALERGQSLFAIGPPEDPWSRLTELAGRLQDIADIPEGQKARSLPKTLDAAQIERGENLAYDPETIDKGVTGGKQAVTELGVDGAIERVLRGEVDIAWASTGYEVLAQLRTDEGVARKAGNTAEADRLEAKKKQFAGDFAERATKLGQAIVGIKAVEEFAPDRALYLYNKASQKGRNKEVSKQEEAQFVGWADELQELRDRNRALHDKLERAQTEKKAKAQAEREAREPVKRKVKTSTYQATLTDRAATILQTLRPKVGKLDLSGLAAQIRNRSEAGMARGVVPGVVVTGPTIPPLPGDAELLAQYAASRLNELRTVADLDAELLKEFGEEVRPFLPPIRQRAYVIRQEARRAELASRETGPERRRTILTEIQGEIADAQKAAEFAEKLRTPAPPEPVTEPRQPSAKQEAREQATITRKAQREERAREAKEARERLAQVKREYKEASRAQVKGYRQSIRAQREAAKKAELWDTAVRAAATEARPRLVNADRKAPETMDDLVSVATEMLLPEDAGGVPRRGATNPSQIYVALKHDFPELVSRRNQAEIYKRAYQRLQDTIAAGREAARLRAANAESRKVWEEQGMDIDSQAILIQQAEVRRRQNELRTQMAAEFNRVSRSVLRRALHEIQAAPRSFMSSIDAPLGRQGIFLLLTHPIENLKGSVPATLKGYAALTHDQYHQRVMEFNQHPRIAMARAAELDLTELASLDDPRLHAEEQFQSAWAEKFPHVRISEQAFILGMNTQRLDAFDRMAAVGESNGYTFENNPEFFKQAASFVNDVTGRGTMPDAAKRLASMANLLAYSMRLNASRVQMLNDLFNPFKYVSEDWNPLHNVPGFQSYDPVMRKLVAQDLIRWIAALTAIYGIAYMLGVGLEFNNPDDPDSLKLRVGNTRYDVTGGEAGTVRFGFRFIRSIALTLAADGTDRREELDKLYKITGTFVRTKLGPWPSATIDYLEGKNVVGDKANLNLDVKHPGRLIRENVLARMLVPMVTGDFMDGYADGGWLGIAKSLPALSGMGVQTYPDSAFTNVGKLKTADEFIPAVKEMKRLRGKGFSGDIYSPKQEEGENDQDFNARALAETKEALAAVTELVKEDWYRELPTREDKQKAIKKFIERARKRARLDLGFERKPKSETPDVVTQ